MAIPVCDIGDARLKALSLITGSIVDQVFNNSVNPGNFYIVSKPLMGKCRRLRLRSHFF